MIRLFKKLPSCYLLHRTPCSNLYGCTHVVLFPGVWATNIRKSRFHNKLSRYKKRENWKPSAFDDIFCNVHILIYKAPDYSPGHLTLWKFQTDLSIGPLLLEGLPLQHRQGLKMYPSVCYCYPTWLLASYSNLLLDFLQCFEVFDCIILEHNIPVGDELIARYTAAFVCWPNPLMDLFRRFTILLVLQNT